MDGFPGLKRFESSEVFGSLIQHPAIHLQNLGKPRTRESFGLETSVRCPPLILDLPFCKPGRVSRPKKKAGKTERARTQPPIWQPGFSEAMECLCGLWSWVGTSVGRCKCFFEHNMFQSLEARRSPISWITFTRLEKSHPRPDRHLPQGVTLDCCHLIVGVCNT